MALFSQYLNHVEIPVLKYSKERGGCYVGRYPLFRSFPVSIVVRNLCSLSFFFFFFFLLNCSLLYKVKSALLS